MNDSNSMIRVVVVDDHPVVLQGIAARLRQHERIELVGEAADGMEGLHLARALHPDVVVTDFEMPVIRGDILTMALAHELPATRVLVYSVYGSPVFIERMIQAGATGFVPKESPMEEMLRLIVQVAEGKEPRRQSAEGHQSGN